MRAGKVVAYCSPECARAAETKPTVVPRPAAATDDDASSKPAGGAAQPAPAAAQPAPAAAQPAPAAAAPAASPRSAAPATAAASTRSKASTPATSSATSSAGATGDHPTVDRDPPRDRPGRARGLLVLAVVVVLGGAGAFLAYRFLIANRDVAASTPRPATPPVAPEVAPPTPAPERPPAVPAVTAAEAVAEARRVLADKLASGTPRVQRVAAAALARTGDPAAIEVLAAALAKETVDVTRLDLAYALARAGDKRGRRRARRGAALAAARRHGSRPAVARCCSAIARAVPVLGQFLEVAQLRLGAAEQLARLAEPRARSRCSTQIRADAEGSSPDDKARATIALGVAGRTDVVPELRALLADARFNAFAAAALAASARCGGAARAGRAARDPVAARRRRALAAPARARRSIRRRTCRRCSRRSPSDKDTEQVHVAEAILLLAGDRRLVGAAMTEGAIRRNLRLFYVFRLLATSYLYVPIFMLFQASRGLSFFERARARRPLQRAW